MILVFEDFNAFLIIKWQIFGRFWRETLISSFGADILQFLIIFSHVKIVIICEGVGIKSL